MVAAKERKGEANKAAVACLKRFVKPSSLGQKPRPEDKGLRNLHLTLKGYPDAEDAGILLAAQRGYFAEAGLNLEISSPVIADNVPGYLMQGASDVGMLPQPQVTMANAEGRPLVAFGSVIRRPVMAVMSLQGSDIESVADLEGKTVAVNSLPSEKAVLQGALEQAGLTLEDVKILRASYGIVDALASGEADAAIGVSPSIEGIELGACGLKPIVVSMRKFGVPPYEELDLVARRDRLVEDPELFRAFVSALARGTAAAAVDPEAAAAAISRARVDLGVASPQPAPLVEAKVEATLPLLSKSGSMDPARTARFARWMRDQGLVQRVVPVSTLLTNRFVESAASSP